jgi:hypothetical protein
VPTISVRNTKAIPIVRIGGSAALVNGPPMVSDRRFRRT